MSRSDKVLSGTGASCTDVRFWPGTGVPSHDSSPESSLPGGMS